VIPHPEGEVGPRSFTLREMPARIATVGDPWADLPVSGQPLRAASEHLGRLQGG
jgi:DNA primase